MKKLNIVFCSFPDFSSNAKVQYDYMVKRYKNNMNYIWVVNSDDMLERLLGRGIETYKMGTEKYYNKMKEADVYFTTHANITGEKIIILYMLNYGMGQGQNKQVFYVIICQKVIMIGIKV